MKILLESFKKQCFDDNIIIGNIHIIVMVTLSGVLYHVEWMRLRSVDYDPMVWPNILDVTASWVI